MGTKLQWVEYGGEYYLYGDRKVPPYAEIWGSVSVGWFGRVFAEPDHTFSDGLDLIELKELLETTIAMRGE